MSERICYIISGDKKIKVTNNRIIETKDNRTIKKTAAGYLLLSKLNLSNYNDLLELQSAKLKMVRSLCKGVAVTYVCKNNILDVLVGLSLCYVFRRSCFSQPPITCSESTIETLEQGVKYVQS